MSKINWKDAEQELRYAPEYFLKAASVEHYNRERARQLDESRNPKETGEERVERYFHARANDTCAIHIVVKRASGKHELSTRSEIRWRGDQVSAFIKFPWANGLGGYYRQVPRREWRQCSPGVFCASPIFAGLGEFVCMSEEDLEGLCDMLDRNPIPGRADISENPFGSSDENYSIETCRKEIQQHHPDRGGDVNQFITWKQRLDAARSMTR